MNLPEKVAPLPTIEEINQIGITQRYDTLKNKIINHISTKLFSKLSISLKQKYNLKCDHQISGHDGYGSVTILTDFSEDGDLYKHMIGSSHDVLGERIGASTQIAPSEGNSQGIERALETNRQGCKLLARLISQEIKLNRYQYPEQMIDSLAHHFKGKSAQRNFEYMRPQILGAPFMRDYPQRPPNNTEAIKPRSPIKRFFDRLQPSFKMKYNLRFENHRIVSVPDHKIIILSPLLANSDNFIVMIEHEFLGEKVLTRIVCDNPIYIDRFIDIETQKMKEKEKKLNKKIKA